MTNFTYRAATFLSEDTFVLANLRHNDLEIMRLVGSNNANTENAIRMVNKLALPALRTGCSLVSMTCRTDSVHVSDKKWYREVADSSIRSAPSCSRRPIRVENVLRCDPNKSLVQFKMYIQNDNLNPGQVANFSFVTHRETLLHCADLSLDFQGGIDFQGVPWNAWGPHTTRWSSSDEIDEAWSASVAGQRQAVVVGEQPRRFRVRDYNVKLLRRVDRESQTRVVTESIATPHQMCFLEDIRSSLPYVEMESDRKYSYDGVLIDETSIIGLTVSK